MALPTGGDAEAGTGLAGYIAQTLADELGGKFKMDHEAAKGINALARAIVQYFNLHADTPGGGPPDSIVFDDDP